MKTTMPAGLTSFERMPYNYLRWNGVVWPDAWVDLYNWELSRIESQHRAGYDTQALVNGLHHLAQQFDYA